MNFFSSFSSKRKFTVPADKKGESAKHFGDDVRTEFAVLLDSNFGAENCLFSGERPLGNHADFLHHMADADRRVRIVIRYEDADVLELRNDLVARRGSEHLERNRNGVLCAFSLFTFHGNRAAHHIDDVFRDRHAKSRTLNAADRRSLLACKRFKEVLLEFPAHADAVVADMEFVECIPFFIVRFLNNTDNDGAAVLCEFRGIAQQIQQNLVQAEKGAGRRWKSCSGIPAPGPAD